MKKFRQAYKDQKNNAAKRGIEFKFTYDQWVAWWEANLGPNWFDLRGCKRGQYVMARHGDAGSYRIENVSCLTVTANHKDQVTNGKCGFVKGHRIRRKTIGGRPKKLTQTQEAEVRKMRGTQKAIAAHFGVSERLIRNIKHS